MELLHLHDRAASFAAPTGESAPAAPSCVTWTGRGTSAPSFTDRHRGTAPVNTTIDGHRRPPETPT